MNAVDHAIEVVGGQAALASAIGVTKQAVNHWRTTGSVPIKRCVDIERATGGAVSLSALATVCPSLHAVFVAVTADLARGLYAGKPKLTTEATMN